MRLLFSLWSFLAVLGGCQSMPTKATGGVAAPTVANAPLEGILLKGNDSQRAIEVITDFSTENANEEGDGKEPSDGIGISRKISITLKNSATVGQVNGLLQKIQARIVWSAKNSPNVEIRLAESADANQTQATLEFLKNQKDVITFAVIVEE